jgi:endo-1,4-beta-xylanase
LLRARARAVSGFFGYAVKRRSLLKGVAAAWLSGMPAGWASALEAREDETLKAAARRTGKIAAVFSGQHQLMYDTTGGKIIADQFDMLAIGNDLKMFRVQPEPGRFDFSYGDYDLEWSQQHGMSFRGHTLVWHNALPKWFKSYVNSSNAEKVMTDHITTVMKHYKGKFYSWDVVNEVVRNIDGRPDGLRAWPWLQPIGPEYLDIAFHTARAADGHCKLILNENSFEHDLPLHHQRRDTLLQLLQNLKKRNVPVDGLGIQGHLQAGVPLATQPMKTFLNQVKDMGLEISISEFDVDDHAVPEPKVDEAVAQTYFDFLELVGPFAKVITLEVVQDIPNLPKRGDGNLPRPNLWDTQYQKKPAFASALKAFNAFRN